MGFLKTLCIFLCLLFTARCEPINLCGSQLQDKCFCGIKYPMYNMYTVDCTDAGFVSADILKHLPKQTEVLIFNGNNFTSLPQNVFGEQETLPKLHTVNLANNNIVEIPGKAFHHVSNVKRLILNDNKIRLSFGRTTEHVHTRVRMFSSFTSLEELQLINAFDDSSDEERMTELHDIFLNSNLSKVTKLYLSNNNLRKIEEPMVFCELQELRELYLDGNYLTDLDFNITCLRHLQFLSLKNNLIRLKDETLRLLDSFPARGQALEVDFQLNPGSCKEKWLNATKVKFRKTEGVGCLRESDIAKGSSVSVTGQILIVLTIFCVFVIIVVIYFRRTQTRSTFNPLTDSVSQKMQYTTLRRRDEPEVDV